MNSLPVGGTTTRTACGRMTRRIAWRLRHAERPSPRPSAPLDRLDAGAHDLGHVGALVHREADERRLERRKQQPVRGGTANGPHAEVVGAQLRHAREPEDQLQQQRRAAKEPDVQARDLRSPPGSSGCAATAARMPSRCRSTCASTEMHERAPRRSTTMSGLNRYSPDGPEVEVRAAGQSRQIRHRSSRASEGPRSCRGLFRCPSVSRRYGSLPAARFHFFRISVVRAVVDDLGRTPPAARRAAPCCLAHGDAVRRRLDLVRTISSSPFALAARSTPPPGSPPSPHPPVRRSAPAPPPGPSRTSAR